MTGTKNGKYNFFNDKFYLAVTFIVFALLTFAFFRWVVDDLYIYFRYVSNFLNGKGIVYNAGEYVEGFSSFLWFMVLSGLGLLRLNPETTSKSASLFFAFSSLYLLYGISKKMIPGVWNLLPVMFTALSLPFVLWSVSGFEVSLYSFLLLLGFHTVIRMSRRKMIPAVFVFFLVSIARPEGFLLSAVLIFWAYFYTEEKRKYFHVILPGYVILFSVFFMFRYYYFGEILPNTYYAKLGYGLFGYNEIRIYRHGIFYILKFFLHNLHFAVLLIVLISQAKIWFREKSVVFILSIIIVQFAFVIYAGGDWMAQYRFLVCIIPFLSLLSAFVLKKMYEDKISGRISIKLFMITVVTFILVNFYFNDFESIKREKELWVSVKSICPDIQSVVPQNSVVANGSAGIIPYFLDNVRFVDVIGLTDRFIAKNGSREDIWFEKYSTDYVYDKNPGWIILWKRKDNTGKYTTELTSPALKYIEADKRFKEYSFVKSYDVQDDLKIELFKK
jgi:arabinofuranosyltransferase